MWGPRPCCPTSDSSETKAHNPKDCESPAGTPGYAWAPLRVAVPVFVRSDESREVPISTWLTGNNKWWRRKRREVRQGSGNYNSQPLRGRVAARSERNLTFSINPDIFSARRVNPQQPAITGKSAPRPSAARSRGIGLGASLSRPAPRVAKQLFAIRAPRFFTFFYPLVNKRSPKFT